jgi:alpha-D-ribose 1-methylphosphonate 5-triphosphate synthase subunit PhnG
VHEALAHAPTGRLKTLADRCLEDLDAAEVRVVRPPEPALVMARVREKVDGEVFNLGEVLVTICEVELAGVPGWAAVLDHDPERALCAAVLDAAGRRGGAEDLISGLLAEAREARRERWARVQPTRVEFEEMA